MFQRTSQLFAVFILSFTLYACGPTPQSPDVANPSPSALPTAAPSASPTPTEASSARVFSETEVDTGITCFESSSNVLIKVAGGQYRFGFDTNRRNKTLLGAEKWQAYLNTIGNAMVTLQAQQSGTTCL